MKAGNSRSARNQVGEAAAALPSARQMLLDAAERLFGRHGIDGVSLREIVAAAGQRNSSAIQYHFTDKNGLVEALLQDRMARVEELRQVAIAGLEDLSALDMSMLLRLLWEPMLDLLPDTHGHWFIQFHLSYHLSHQALNGPFAHPVVADPAHHPATHALLSALELRCPELDYGQFRYRLGLIFMMFWAAVCRHDNAALAANEAWSTRFSLDEILKIAVPALMAAA